MIIGTDTGVGKTTISAALARSLRSKGVNVGVMKPFAASKRKYSIKYRSEDTAILAEAAGVSESDIEINPFFYTLPAAPYVAACITGEPAITIPTALNSIEKVRAKHDVLIVEGIGGLMVPLTEKETFADFAKAVNAPMILVARCKIGALNHIILTIHVSRSYGLRIAGVVLNIFPTRPSIINRHIMNTVTRSTGVEVLCIIPRLSRERQNRLELNDEILGKIISRLDLGGLFNAKS